MNTHEACRAIVAIKATPVVVADALRKTTEALARELAQPTAEKPAWTATEWRIARAVAAIHGVSSLLRDALKWRGPDRWQQFLDDQQHQIHGRHLRIEPLLRNIDRLARRHGVAVTPLKGAALHALGIYAPGERPMADVDLLARHADREAVAYMLGQIGYEESSTTWKHTTFVPRDSRIAAGFGEHKGNPIKIELHSRVLERLPVVCADITDRIWHASQEPGLHGYPTLASLMIHLLLHTAGNMQARSARMIQLHDIARLAARMGGNDWAQVTRDRALWWALPPLMLTARYYQQAIPAEVLAATTPACPRHLRRICERQTLTDVSLSRLWVEAFPGIEWSTTGADLVRCMIGRVRPDRELLAAREHLVRSHPWMSDHSWSRLPQWRRILRFVLGRPPRVETMHSVAAVLGEESGAAG